MSVVEFRGVTVDYSGNRPLSDVNVIVGPGTTAVTGPSGSGKSTLLRLVAGVQRPTHGSVLIDGRPVVLGSWTTPSDLRVVMIRQDYRLVPFLTVRENVALAMELRAARRQAVDERRIMECLAAVALDADLLDRMPQTLSGGEQQRVAIARALACEARVIVADEATGALDTDNTSRVAAVLARLGEQGLTVLVATHDAAVSAVMGQHLTLRGATLAPAG